MGYQMLCFAFGITEKLLALSAYSTDSFGCGVKSGTSALPHEKWPANNMLVNDAVSILSC